MNIAKVAGLIVRESWLTVELEIDRRLADLADRARDPLLNLTPQLREAVAGGAVLNWRFDDHLTPAGNRFVAEVIATWLKGGEVFNGLQ